MIALTQETFKRKNFKWKKGEKRGIKKAGRSRRKCRCIMMELSASIRVFFLNLRKFVKAKILNKNF